MRKVYISLWLLCVCAAAAHGQGRDAAAARDNLEHFMQRVNLVFSRGNIDMLHAQFASDLQGQWPLDALETLYGEKIRPLGAMQEMRKIKSTLVEEGTNQHLQVAYRMVFEDGRVWLRYVLDKDGKVLSFEID